MTDLKQRIGLTMYHHMTEAITDLNGTDRGNMTHVFLQVALSGSKAVSSVDVFIYMWVFYDLLEMFHYNRLNLLVQMNNI